MRRFDETSFSNKETKWQDITLEGKWCPVIIESPDIISYDDTVSMIMRCDGLFSGYRRAGNDYDWNNKLCDAAGCPVEIPFSYREELKKHYPKFDYWEFYNLKVEEFRKEWNTNPGSHSDFQIFQVELFSSCYAGGPLSFVNYKTGKVGFVHNIGKWPESIDEAEEELEWFAKTYPQYKFFVTFCDDPFIDESREIKPVCTLMLYEGEIKQVTTRTYRDFKYVFKINHLKGSYLAKKRRSFFKRLIRYYRLRRFIYEKIISKISVSLYNEYVIQHNYSFNFDNEKYFDYPHAMSVIDDWLRILKEGGGINERRN